MDSFSIFFRERPSDDEVVKAIVASGATASYLAPGDIAASRREANIWLESYSSADVPSWREWPIAKHEVKGILSIAVSRNEESSYLAVEIAHQLATRLGGVIGWGGNDYWSGLFDRLYPPCT
jgi:hypothetical protein